jgi:predicted CoA-binding protein
MIRSEQLMPLVEDKETLRQILLNARTIAVVGLSEKPWRDSHTVSAYLQDKGYRIIPVNPVISAVLGVTSVPRLEDIEEQVHIVDVFRRPEHVPAIVESAIAIGAETLWLQSGIIHEAAAIRASEAGMNVVMDRCIRVAHSLLVRQNYSRA